MTRTGRRSAFRRRAAHGVAAGTAALLVCAPVRAGTGSADAMYPPDSAAARGRCVAGPDPFEVRLVPTAHANGAAGTARLVFSDSPFVVSVTPDGHHQYDVTVSTTGLETRDDVLVVWAATPELDEVRKLGVLDEHGALVGARIAFNKFLVFVTAEADADVERWTGRILLRGISPSGRLHTMAGHGPFQGESCGGMFGPQW